MTKRPLFALSLVVALGCGAAAPDVLEAALQYYKLVYENDVVRVFEHKLPPGHREAPHAHGCRITYALGESALRNHRADGSKDDARHAFRAVWWRPAEEVSLENMASRDAFELVVEFKRPLPGVAGCETAAAPADSAAWATPATLKWTTDAKTGVARADLIGDRTQPGPFVQRVRLPAGFRAAPHTHSVRLESTVIAGEVRFRFAGDPREVVLPAGSFVTVPPGLVHEEWTESSAEFEVRGVGPVVTIPAPAAVK